ncbi:MAG: YCF48-related protein [Ignavibacteriaceae bacterium]|nr:YCF48-related protein [Ignavibacteriaceae bacterium]
MRKFTIFLILSLCLNPLFVKAGESGNNSNKAKNKVSYFDYLNDVKMVNQNTGYAVGWAGTIVRTTDGGLNWKVLSSPMNGLELGGVFFISENTGMAVNGLIIRTTDGGDNWNVIDSGSPLYLAGISFADMNNGFSVGSNGKITHSSDGGISWSLQQSGTTVFLWNVSAVSANNAFVVGGNYSADNGAILKTTNAGRSWVNLPLPSTAGLLGISFPNLNNATAVGSYGTILHTTNEGNTWEKQNSNTAVLLKSVSFIDTLNGIVVGNNGVILKTTNGGNTWILRVSNTNQTLSGVAFVNSNLAIAVGGSMGNPVIIVSSDGGQTWVDRINPTFVNNERIVTPSFTLKQNYPNPFNPVTIIEFAIPDRHFISLKIYNSIGNEIETLINKELEPGNHSVPWNPTNLPSGVYYYCLKVGDFIQTKKLIFLK